MAVSRNSIAAMNSRTRCSIVQEARSATGMRNVVRRTSTSEIPSTPTA